MNQVESLIGSRLVGDAPICLYNGKHQVWWIGSNEVSPFRCNAYLIVDGPIRVLVDPGSGRWHFPQVKARVEPVSYTHLTLPTSDLV